MKNVVFHSEPEIFTTGALLKPMKIIDSAGKEIWVWYVSEFIEDTFKDGKAYNPKESGENFIELLSEI